MSKPRAAIVTRNQVFEKTVKDLLSQLGLSYVIFSDGYRALHCKEGRYSDPSLEAPTELEDPCLELVIADQDLEFYSGQQLVNYLREGSKGHHRQMFPVSCSTNFILYDPGKNPLRSDYTNFTIITSTGQLEGAIAQLTGIARPRTAAQYAKDAAGAPR